MKSESKTSPLTAADQREGSALSCMVSHDAENLRQLGYQQAFKRNRSFYTILFQSIALVAVSLSLHTYLATGASIDMFYSNTLPSRSRMLSAPL